MKSQDKQNNHEIESEEIGKTEVGAEVIANIQEEITRIEMKYIISSNLCIKCNSSSNSNYLTKCNTIIYSRINNNNLCEQKWYCLHL